MKRNELEQKILEQHPKLLQTNLRQLLKPHLESWVNTNEVTLSTEALVKIFSERNERAEINQRLNNENFSLTAQLNAKIKEFVALENSEIVKAGQWLFNSLSKFGKERQDSLLEKGLVHKDDYNHAVNDLSSVIRTQQEAIDDQVVMAARNIQDLEKRTDELQKQLSFIQDYIVNNYGHNNWNQIKTYIQNHI